MSVQPLSAFAVTLKQSSPSIYSRASSAVSHHAVDCAAIAKGGHGRTFAMIMPSSSLTYSAMPSCGAAAPPMPVSYCSAMS